MPFNVEKPPSGGALSGLERSKRKHFRASLTMQRYTKNKEMQNSSRIFLTTERGITESIWDFPCPSKGRNEFVIYAIRFLILSSILLRHFNGRHVETLMSRRLVFSLSLARRTPAA